MLATIKNMTDLHDKQFNRILDGSYYPDKDYDGYNQAITDTITTLQALKEEITSLVK